MYAENTANCKAQAFINAVLEFQDLADRLAKRSQSFVHPHDDEENVSYLPTQVEYETVLDANFHLRAALAGTSWTDKLWQQPE